MIAKSIRIRGLVQGVGFRPTVWVIANRMKLCGKVLNDGEGVAIELFGFESEVVEFIENLRLECPPLARIDSIEQTELDTDKPKDFRIAISNKTVAQTGIVADAASCKECIKDVFNKTNRRYNYPFTNCTHCGPRLTIIKAIPYDRKNTSMAPFLFCKKCQREYKNPANRRFHAQPNACSDCGPKIELWPKFKESVDDIQATIDLLKAGKIIAIKGIGGFHLACDASNQQAVITLRKRKKRSTKPFALMTANTEVIKNYCHINSTEKQLLESNIAPIVILKNNNAQSLPKEIAPGQNSYGFMLPYSPLHHLILAKLNNPLVMTSGNASDFPQCIDNDEALENLKGIADYWLLNNRDIVNRVDDSVLRFANKKTQVLRRARGYAPTSIPLPKGFKKNNEILACGGELKNTFCLIKNGMATLSQHIGDLKNSNTYEDYQKTIGLFKDLYQHNPKTIAIDSHPDYLSSKYGKQLAQNQNLKLVKIQHHHAHIASVLAENNWGLNQGEVLGITLDGIGFGNDGSFWGGEFLLADYQCCKRLGRLKPMPLLGGSQAMQQPWRNTYANLSSYFDWSELKNKYKNLEIIKFLEKKPSKTLDAMIEKNINAPMASSCGRLFDAVAAAIGICTAEIQYEGQAAIELEALVSKELLHQEKPNFYKININQTDNNLLEVECYDLWKSILADLHKTVDKTIIATRFHLGLANVLVNMTQTILKKHKTTKVDTIVLSGGVFQNQILLETTCHLLSKQDYKVLTHSQIPANDGGISLGQAVIAMVQQQMEQKTCV